MGTIYQNYLVMTEKVASPLADYPSNQRPVIFAPPSTTQDEIRTSPISVPPLPVGDANQLEDKTWA